MHSFSTDQPKRYNRYIIIGIIASSTVWVAQYEFGIELALSTGAIAAIIYYAFTRRIWKSSYLREYGLVKVPDLNGSWEGHLYTSAPAKKIGDDLIVEEGKQIDELIKMEAAIKIDQNWDSIQVTFIGPESMSDSKAASIMVRESHWPTLNYNYLNQGSAFNEELYMHYGTTTLQYHPDEDILKGPYYTQPDRNRHGFIEVSRVD